MNNLNTPAQPMPLTASGSVMTLDNEFESFHKQCRAAVGMTKRERACIDLRIPESGDAELDALIRKARRQELATMTLQGMAAFHGDGQAFSTTAEESIECADALLKVLERTHADP